MTSVLLWYFFPPSPSLQTVTAELVLRFRRKRRRSLRRWARLSACFQTQRRSLAMTAVRIWRMMAWTWEVSTWASLGVEGGLKIKVQVMSELTNHLFTVKQLSLLWREPGWKVLCVDVDCFCLHQILMPTTFSRHSLEAQEVLVLKVIYVLYVYKNLCEKRCFSTVNRFENTSVTNLFVLRFSIWTRKFLLSVWLIGGFVYLNSYYIRTFQQCQPPDPPSIFNDWPIASQILVYAIDWMQPNDHMQQMI